MQKKKKKIFTLESGHVRRVVVDLLKSTEENSNHMGWYGGGLKTDEWSPAK